MRRVVVCHVCRFFVTVTASSGLLRNALGAFAQLLALLGPELWPIGIFPMIGQAHIKDLA